MSDTVNLDQILNKFRLNQRYHLRLTLLVAICYMTNCLHTLNYIFAFEEVKYRCISQNTSQVYCNLKSNETCNEWIYDKPDSFVAEFGLACQDWKRTTVGTVHSFGYMCGLLLVGPFSDRVGRKAAVVITGTLGGVFGILKSFSNWYLFYIAMEFLEAALGDLCSPIYVLTLEFVSAEKRSLYVLINHFGVTIGKVLFALIAWFVPHRRTFLRVIYTPALLFTVYSYLLDESPRWYLTKGRKESAIAVLEKASKISKITLNKDSLENLGYELKEDKRSNRILKQTLQSRVLRNRFFICLVWWTTATFVSFGMRINSVSLKGNKHLNYIFLALPEIPATFVWMYILKRFKRKKPLISCFLAGAFFCLVQPFMPSDMPWFSILLFVAGNLMSTFYFTITYLYTSELFPTYSRNSMHALCSSLGRIGSIVAPQTPLLMRYWSGLPPIIFGLVSLFAGLITFLMPDVGDDSLPDTMQQAEAIGKQNVLKDRCSETTNVSRL